ncbi:MAG: 50S ribosomal protein L5 [Candidatus Spechtbacterales bacterium]
MITLEEKYNKETVRVMQKKFGYKNIYAVPKLKKIVVNSGVAKMINARKGKEVTQGDEDLIRDIISELALIVGQKPQIVRAKKSIAGFKLRAGMIAGVRVTLRGKKMYDFLTRLISIAFPRSRDFRGFRAGSVDETGNMTVGLGEQIIFPEIPHDKVRQMWGMEVTIVTSARNREEGTELLRQLGMPFQK